MALRQAGHQHRRKDRLSRRKTEKGDPSRNHEEQSVLDETGGAGDSNRVVLAIVVLALLFIVIITYFVAHMPQKA
jgi:hypothetical protein